MARVTAERVEQTKRKLLEAAQRVLVHEGYSGLSTRRVAEAAGMQMSQIQYHFGSKEGMVLALFEFMNAGLIERQTRTFDDPDLSVAQKWMLACDYLDEDLESGYVRVLQELIAAGWTQERIGEATRAALGQWHELLTRLAREALQEFEAHGPFPPENIATLIASAFLGAEALILLGYEDRIGAVRVSLRQIGDLIATLEQRKAEE